MSTATLLSLVQEAFGELGLDEPTAVANGGDGDAAAQMFRLANRVGRSLARRYPWSFLTVEGATITLATGQETYALPADFDRLVPGTTWDRTNRWLTLGPDDAQTARMRREGIFQTAPRRAVRQVGGSITVWPVPTTAGDVLAFDYVSKNWAATSGGVPQLAFAADTDMTVYPSHLMVLGLKWRWQQAKGMEFGMLKAEYDAEVTMAWANDQGGGQVLNMAGPGSRERGNADDVTAASPFVTLAAEGGAGIGIE